MCSISNQKKVLRSQVRTTLRSLPAHYKASQSNVVCQQLSADIAHSARTSVMLYMALPDELSLDSLISSLQSSCPQKKIYLPVMHGQDIVPHLFTSRSDIVVESQYGIAEPRYTPTFDISCASDLIVVVPGLAFDACGHRLGRGKGFYDHFLAQVPTALTLGVCFDCQLVPSIPIDAFDYPVSRVYCPQLIHSA